MSPRTSPTFQKFPEEKDVELSIALLHVHTSTKLNEKWNSTLGEGAITADDGRRRRLQRGRDWRKYLAEVVDAMNNKVHETASATLEYLWCSGVTHEGIGQETISVGDNVVFRFEKTRTQANHGV